MPASTAQPAPRPRRGSARQRRILLLGAALLVMVVVLFYPQAFNLSSVHVSVANTWLLFALSALSFLAIIALSLVLLRQLLKLYLERRANVLGAKFKTKLVIGALGLSLIPVVCMFGFTYGLINRTLDKWFSRPVEAVRDDGARVTDLLESYVRGNAGRQAALIAADPRLPTALASGESGRESLDSLLADYRARLGGGFALVIGHDGRALAGFGWPAADPPPSARSEEADVRGQRFLVASAPLAAGEGASAVVVGLAMPPPLAARVARLSADYQAYEQLGRDRKALRRLYTLYLALLTLAILFAATWFALYLSKLVVVPIQALAGATEEIARGNLGHRIEVRAKDEIRALVESFNRMAADLEGARRRLEAAGEQLRGANAELEARRRFTETLLESIPSAVIALDREDCVTRVNPAVGRLFGERARGAARLDDLFDGESRQELRHLFRKSERLGVTAGQMEISAPASGPGRGFTAAITVAAIPSAAREGEAAGGVGGNSGGGIGGGLGGATAGGLGGAAGGNAGHVLVLEDLTDVLNMQRVAAWREAARRIAHEIKNPLTPIALSAQRIQRWLARPAAGAEALAVIAECAAGIETEARSLGNLVDEFSAFARFPAPKPVPCDLNAVVAAALKSFDGRLEGIRVRADLASLPPLKLDPEEMRRVFVNLIDNAAEAVRAGPYREICVATAAGDGVVEAWVADTGPGISPADKERIFLPYVSSKQRGTGLGLAIVSRIVSDHGAAIRVEDNVPVGTRFVIAFAAPE